MELRWQKHYFKSKTVLVVPDTNDTRKHFRQQPQDIFICQQSCIIGLLEKFMVACQVFQLFKTWADKVFHEKFLVAHHLGLFWHCSRHRYNLPTAQEKTQMDLARAKPETNEWFGY